MSGNTCNSARQKALPASWRHQAHEGPTPVKAPGRGINAVSVSADERLIAVSVGPNRSIGSVKDSVYVIRAWDGKEIYRRFLAPYSRSQPVFLGSNHLAFTTIAQGKPTIRVLRIPAKAAKIP